MKRFVFLLNYLNSFLSLPHDDIMENKSKAALRYTGTKREMRGKNMKTNLTI